MSIIPNSNLIALDVGERRIGVAIASFSARLPRPLITIYNDQQVFTNIFHLIKDEEVSLIVVGMPHNLTGEDTKQTSYVQQFINKLHLEIPDIQLDSIDEALTSIKAESELKAHDKIYRKEDIDALAAVYILEDYLSNLSH